MENGSINGKGFKFNFCPSCGSPRIVYDHLRMEQGRHRFCKNCGRRWIVILDTFNDFGEELENPYDIRAMSRFIGRTNG